MSLSVVKILYQLFNLCTSFFLSICKIQSFSVLIIGFIFEVFIAGGAVNVMPPFYLTGWWKRMLSVMPRFAKDIDDFDRCMELEYLQCGFT